MADVDVIVDITAGDTSAEGAADDVSEAIGGVGETSQTAGQQLQAMSGQLIAATAALAGVGATLASAASASAEFSERMAEVSTLFGEDDPFNLDQMANDVNALSFEFGGKAPENAEALYGIISAGATDSADAIDILTASNKLAVGGVTDVATAADGLTSVMNAYGTEAGTTAEVSDKLFAAMKAGKTTIPELSKNLGDVAPIAANAGVELDDLLASTAAITAGGVKTSQAITQVKSAITAIIKPSKTAADLAAELGIEFNAAALESQGFAGFLKTVKDATGGNVEQLSALFGSVEGLSSVLTLTGKGAEKFASTMDSMAASAGFTEEAVGKMMDTPAASAARFGAAMSGVQGSLGDAVVAFKPVLDTLTDLINVFNEMEGGTKATIAGIAALTVAVPAVTLAIGAFVKAGGLARQMLVGATAGATAQVSALTRVGAAYTEVTVATESAAVAASAAANAAKNATAVQRNAAIATEATARASLGAAAAKEVEARANLAFFQQQAVFGPRRVAAEIEVTAAVRARTAAEHNLATATARVGGTTAAATGASQAHAAAMAHQTAATGAAAAAASRASLATAALGAAMKIAFPLLILAPFADDAARLAASFSDAAKSLEEFSEARKKQIEDEIESLNQLVKEKEEVLDFEIKSREELRLASEESIRQYQEEVQAVREQLELKQSILFREREIAELQGNSAGQQIAALAAIKKELDGIKASQDGIPEAIKFATDEYYALERAAALAGAAAKESADELKGQIIDVSALGKISGEALFDLGKTAEDSLKLAKEELDKLELAFPALEGASREVLDSWHAGFGEAKDRILELTEATDSLRTEALARLGLDGEEISTGLSADFRDAADAVDLLSIAADSSSKEIRLALSELVKLADTDQEVGEVSGAIDSIAKSGRLSKNVVVDLRNELLGVVDAGSEVEKAFKRLGVTSTKELQRIKAEAIADFATIKADGTAAPAQVQAAFIAMGEKIIASGDKSQIAILKTQARVRGLTEELFGTGEAGLVAGDKIAGGMDQASAATDRATASTARYNDEKQRTGDIENSIKSGRGLHNGKPIGFGNYGGTRTFGGGGPVFDANQSNLFNRYAAEYGADFGAAVTAKFNELINLNAFKRSGGIGAATAQALQAVIDRFGAVSPGGGGPSQAVNINIAGVLDVNDSATIDSLARKLAPAFENLTRRKGLNEPVIPYE